MKQSVIALLLGLSSTTIFAVNDEGKQNQYNLAVGLAGSKVGSNELGGDAKFKGFFVNGSYHLNDRYAPWVEYSFQTGKNLFGTSGIDFDVNEISVGFNSKIFEDEKIYLSMGTGIGLASVDESFSDSYNSYTEEVHIKLDYVTVPISFELGLKASQNMSGFVNVGYKWFYERSSEITYKECSSSRCRTETLKNSGVDVDGTTYKIGLRYSF